MKLDLSDLVAWPDGDLVEALEEIDSGLSRSDILWVERFASSYRSRIPRKLTRREREVARAILRRWNDGAASS